jgi:scyllo-inositol 2-dehydrogenase (NADP+)
MKRFKKASDVRVGVIGYGGAFNMGKAHLNEMQKAGMTPVAVAEIDKDRLKVAEDDFPGIQTFSSVATMLKKADVNLVTIITPHNTHAKLALQCLKAGCSVVCEKPLAITTEECDSMIREAKKRKLVLSTYHNRHWDSAIMEAVKRVRKGEIGEIVRIEGEMGGYQKPGDWWRSSKKISGGIMYDWGVHILEYSLQVMDDEILEVSGCHHTGFWNSKSAWKDDTNEDEGFLMVRFKKGGWLTLNISSINSNPKKGMLQFFGTKGSIMMVNPSAYEVHKKNSNGEQVVTSGRSGPAEGWRYYQNVSDHMVKGTELVISPEWSRRPIHILDLAGKSAKAKKAIKAKYK